MQLRFLFFPVMAGLVSCLSPAGQRSPAAAPGNPERDTSYAWTKLLDSAAWDKTYNYQLFSIRDTLRVFHPDGGWYSADGNTWQQSSLTDAVGNQAFLDYVFFRGAVYGLGYFEGNIERHRFEPVIVRSTDLRHWDTLSLNSNLPRLFFCHPFVFRDKIWIVGGETEAGPTAEIWNSADGIRWERQTATASFGPRSSSRVVLLNDTLYLLNNDVWQSTDGLNWIRVQNQILPGMQVFGYDAVVWDKRIWLLGCNRNGLFSNQVMFSRDGRDWKTLEAPWLPRGGVAAGVHRDAIYMTGGKYGGTPDHTEFRYDNDLWMLTRKTVD